MLYLTFNDPPSGIYRSQVIDVCRFMEDRLGEKVRLIAFISLRGFLQNRKKIRRMLPGSTVVPMYPGVSRWKKNAGLLSLFISRDEKIVARGPFAAWLALQMKRKQKVPRVCFDARGAYTAEFNEYNVSGSEKLNAEIRELEKEVILRSDGRLAVSEELVRYWQKEFGYKDTKHVVIPCTLAGGHFPGFDERLSQQWREKLGYSVSDVVVVYSGSTAGWQSLQLLQTFYSRLLEKDKAVKALILSQEAAPFRELGKRFPGRVLIKWVEPEEVRPILMAADHGMLFRESTVTNKVSSPVKFAEYLSCGLKVFISEHIGDLSRFVADHDAGSVCASDVLPPVPQRQSTAERDRIAGLARQYFTKENYLKEYKELLSF